jgi:hypothetical protein
LKGLEIKDTHFIHQLLFKIHYYKNEQRLGLSQFSVIILIYYLQKFSVPHCLFKVKDKAMLKFDPKQEVRNYYLHKVVLIFATLYKFNLFR